MKRSLFFAFTAIIVLLLLSCSWGQPTPVTVIEGDVECTAITPPDGAETILIPTGSFLMGSSGDDTPVDEIPQHSVSLTCYNIYKQEVTNAMYNACVDAGVCFSIQPVPDTLAEQYDNPAYADKPAVGIDYNMASDYCEWIGGRLPTEAEWEYAALKTTNKIYPWGDAAADCEHADFTGCSDPNDTVAVGTLIKGESPFKVADMAGNAWEWVFDWYAEDFYAASPASNPVGPSEGETKVVRGGAYNSIVDMLDSTNRHAGDPYRAYSNVGFRCVIGALALPEDYSGPDPHKHDIPNHDDPLDDDDPKNPGHPLHTKYLKPVPPDCPDANDVQHITIQFKEPGNWTFTSFSLNNIPYTCDPYDQVNHSFYCSGPIPPPDAQPSYTGKFCYKDNNGMGLCAIGIPFPKPQNCDQNQGTDSMKVLVECPINGQIIANFAYSPAVVWTKVMISSDMDLMNCLPISPNAMTCFGPDKLTNGQYMFHLEGTFNNNNILDLEYADPPASCPDQSDHPWSKPVWGCENGSPVLEVFYIPADSTDVQITVDGNMPQCNKITDGHAQCPIDPFLSGSTVPVEICVDGSCVQMNSNIPDCANVPSFGNKIVPFCDAKGAGIKILYGTAPASPISEVTANNIPLTCGQNSPTQWTCSGLPGLPGDVLALKITHTNGDVENASIQFPSCQSDGKHQYWSWLGCQNDGQYTFDTDIDPWDGKKMTSISLEGQQLVCEMNFNGYSPWCEDIDLTPGETASFKVCYSDGTCKTFDHVVPTCDASADYKYWSILSCEDDSQYTFDSDVLPANPPWQENPIVSTKMDGQLLTCDCMLPFDCWCRNLDLNPGDAHTFEVCYTYGPCQTWQYTTPKCTQYDDCSCRILEVGCLSETSLEFRAQVCAQDPKPLMDGSVSAYDSHTNYSCALIPGFDGRIYCSGPYPNPLSDMLFLEYQYVGSASSSICTISGWKGMIPGCQTPKQCSEFTDQNSCEINNCNWVNIGLATPLWVCQ